MHYANEPYVSIEDRPQQDMTSSGKKQATSHVIKSSTVSYIEMCQAQGSDNGIVLITHFN